MMITSKSFATYLLLTIVTCGIYHFCMVYMLTNDFNRMAGQTPHNISPTAAVILSILLGNIYSCYWIYQMGLRVDRMSDANAIPREDSASGYLAWTLGGFLTFGIASYIGLYRFFKQFNRLVNAYNSVLPVKMG